MCNCILLDGIREPGYLAAQERRREKERVTILEALRPADEGQLEDVGFP